MIRSKKEARLLSGETLAYLGDSVIELCVRSYLVERGIAQSGDLNRASLAFVSATAQAEAVRRILPILSEDELGEDTTKVTVYSNQKTVELFANGVSLGVKEAEDHYFYFDVPNVGETKLVAISGDLKDESVIRKVEEPNPAYRLVEKGAVLNWWDITEIDGQCSLNSKLKVVIDSVGQVEAGKLIFPFMAPMASAMGVSAEQSAGMMTMMNNMTMLRIISLITGMMRIEVSKEQLLELNEKLNKIAVK